MAPPPADRASCASCVATGAIGRLRLVARGVLVRRCRDAGDVRLQARPRRRRADGRRLLLRERAAAAGAASRSASRAEQVDRRRRRRRRASRARCASRATCSATFDCGFDVGGRARARGRRARTARCSSPTRGTARTPGIELRRDGRDRARSRSRAANPYARELEDFARGRARRARRRCSAATTRSARRARSRRSTPRQPLPLTKGLT